MYHLVYLYMYICIIWDNGRYNIKWQTLVIQKKMCICFGLHVLLKKAGKLKGTTDFLLLFWNIKLPRWIVWLVSTFIWLFEEGREMTCFLSCAYEKHVVFYLNFWIKEVEIDYVCLFIFCENTNNIISQG